MTLTKITKQFTKTVTQLDALIKQEQAKKERSIAIARQMVADQEAAQQQIDQANRVKRKIEEILA